MRHSDIKLTMNVYTDPKLLDVAGALDALPALPLDDRQAEREAVRATGTDDETARTLAPLLAPTLALTDDKRGAVLSIAGKVNKGEELDSLAVSVVGVKRKDSLTSAVNESCESGREDLNLRPLGPEATRATGAFGSKTP
jgi:hypothetical protein